MPSSPAAPHPGRIGPNGSWVPSRFGGTKRVTDRGLGTISGESTLFVVHTAPSSSFTQTEPSLGSTATIAPVSYADPGGYRQGFGFLKGSPIVLVKVERRPGGSDSLFTSE